MALALLVVPATAGLAQNYPKAVAGVLGAAGSADETEAGFGNPTWQVTFTSEVAEKTSVAGRLGGIHWSSGDYVGEIEGPSLLYVTLAGEYHESRASFSKSLVEPSIFIGLGFYHLEGETSEGESASESAPGLAVGLAGDIPLNAKRNLTLRMEISGHYAALNAAQLFAMAHFGLSYRF